MYLIFSTHPPSSHSRCTKPSMFSKFHKLSSWTICETWHFKYLC